MAQTKKPKPTASRGQGKVAQASSGAKGKGPAASAGKAGAGSKLAATQSAEVPWHAIDVLMNDPTLCMKQHFFANTCLVVTLASNFCAHNRRKRHHSSSSWHRSTQTAALASAKAALQPGSRSTRLPWRLATLAFGVSFLRALRVSSYFAVHTHKVAILDMRDYMLQRCHSVKISLRQC
jgi:hypothetical protein